MTVKPSQNWRAAKAEEARGLAAGTLSPECAPMAELFPDELIDATDAVLEAFEADLRGLTLGDRSDERVLQVVERVVRALNAVNDAYGGAAYETGEREELCAYMDAALTAHGTEVGAVAARAGMGRHEITDRWRDW
jgi:hypothetical protein